MNASSQQIVLAQRPHGNVSSKDFRLEDVVLPDLEAGGIEMETLFISIDPAIRGWLDDGRVTFRRLRSERQFAPSVWHV